jgi:hypothetical protein
MAQYRKKPVVIEAIQLTNSNVREVYSFIYGDPIIKCNMDAVMWDEYVNNTCNTGMRLKTLESHNETQIASIGDFIIKGVDGEFYPCGPDIFEKTYEKVDELAEGIE